MFLRFVLVLLISAFLFSCEKKVKEKYPDIPPTVLSAIREHVGKNFAGDTNIAETWVERQVNAYREIIKIVPVTNKYVVKCKSCDKGALMKEKCSAFHKSFLCRSSTAAKAININASS